MRATSLVLAAALGLSGCYAAVKRRFLDEEYRTEAVHLPYSLSRSNVIDKREHVSPQDIKIPTISFRPEHSTVSPPLTEEHKALFQSEIDQYFLKGRLPVKADIEILDATKEFETGWPNSKMTVAVRTKVTLVDLNNNRTFVYAVGEGRFFIQSDASAEYTEKLYQKAMKVSIFQAAKFFKYAKTE